MNCPKCQNQISDLASFCPYCGTNLEKLMKRNSQNDSHPWLWFFLALFVPFFGIIFWGITRSDTPRRAKFALLGAIIGFILSVIFSILFTLLPALLSFFAFFESLDFFAEEFHRALSLFFPV